MAMKKGRRSKMPVISKIRFTNVIYENGNKRYQDETFHFDGQNASIVLENGGGKTVWVQAALQAILPHAEVAGRKVYETFLLSEGCAHIAIEWTINQKPRRYLVTAVSLYEQSQRLQSYRYAYEYGEDDPHSLENMPFVEDLGGGGKRPVDKAEIQEYYARMTKNNFNAKVFKTIELYHDYLSSYHIIAQEWKKISQINEAEGGVGKFFEDCKTSSALVERLLIPIVEDAISGDGTKKFVESFEKQREHIKKYRQLKDQIHECESILKQVQGFTTSFEKWDQEQTAFNHLKSKAKAVFYLIEKEEEKETKEHESQLQDQENIREALKTLKYKKASYALQVLQKEVDKKHQAYKEALERFEKTQFKLKEANHRIASLEYVKIRQSLQDSHQEEKGVKEAIRRLDLDDAVAEIQDKLEENSQHLCGYFKNALQVLEKEKNQFEIEKTRSGDALKVEEKEKASLEKEKRSLEEAKTQKITTIDLAKEEIISLKQSILDRPQDERVEDKEIEFKKRFEAIEQETRQIFDQRKELKNEQEALGLNQSILLKELDELKDHYREDQNNLKILEDSHQSLLEKIHAADYKWSHIDSVYQEPLLLSSIETQIEKARISLKEARQDERSSLRWLDDYQEGDYFIADPTIQGKIQEWKKDFTLLLTGAQYSQDAKTGDFPYWPITLITTDQEAAKLQTTIEKNKDDMTQPIWVMTEQEAAYYLKNDYNNENKMIYPGLWESNIDPANFSQWKKALGEKAALAQASRREIQNTYQDWQALKEALVNFQQAYPMEERRELKDSLYKNKEKISKKENTRLAMEERKKEISQQLESLMQEEGQLDKEYTSIASKMQDIRVYLEKNKITQSHAKELRELIYPRLDSIESRLNYLKKNIDHLNELIQEVAPFLWELGRNKDQLQTHPLYQETKGHRPIYSSYSQEALASERENLKQELGKEQRGRRELDQQLKKILQSRERDQDLLETQLLKYPGLDQEIPYLADHQRDIKALIQTRAALQREVASLGDKQESLKSLYDKSQGDYTGQKKKFNEQYREVFQWEESLISVKEDLKREEKDLSSKLAYIEDQLERSAKALGHTKEAKDFLLMKNEHFKYLAEDMATSQLEDNEKLDILYQKAKYSHQMIKSLEEAEEKVTIKEDSLKKEELAFTNFCRSHIKNIKLQNLTLKGIENLKSYPEVTQWESNLNKRIMHTKKIAEDDIKTHAEELELFINFIHSYVKQVAHGLGEIHRKTRIKIEDKWKDVYTIKVPEWEDLEGKEKIQDHVLWIINQLESGKHPQETHRREIEKWLSVKQLLGVVTQNKPIIVRCRKLTNKNTLASIPSSWESSNKWSGGERWSKNMILFLGLLNFLAEKTGHVIEGQKRNRAVILDNPFGQASSDHVLNPVFFVAQQLGFQIITLTALAEGSFIRKYFPVVYSCRLRKASDGTQVMGTDQQIQRALFKDDELPSISRLETQEQMSLLS